MWVTVCDIGTSGKCKDNRKLTKSIPNLCSCRTSPFLFTFHMPPGLGRFVLYARITSDCVTAPPSSCENANPSVKLYDSYTTENTGKKYVPYMIIIYSTEFYTVTLSNLHFQGNKTIKLNVKMNHKPPNASE